MTTYAHYISETSVSYPNPAEFKGIPNWHSHDSLLRSRGFVPLVNEHEEREGFAPEPTAYELVTQTKTVTVSRPVTVTDYELDEESNLLLDEDGQPVISGQHTEYQRVTETADDSFIRVTTWDYQPISEPEQEPVVVVYSKYKLKCKLVELRLWDQVKSALEASGYWDSFLLVDPLSSDNEELQAALPLLVNRFPDVDIPELLKSCEV